MIENQKNYTKPDLIELCLENSDVFATSYVATNEDFMVDDNPIEF